MSETSLYTAGDIAKELKIPYDRAAYLIRENGIEPVGRIGVARVFNREGLAKTREALRRMGPGRRKLNHDRLEATTRF